ncbi:MAG: hypothetical protein ABEH58_08645 [Haloplanus sp.]
MDGDDGDRQVLRVLARGRSNRHHLCQRSGLDDVELDRVLTTLGTAGLVTEIDRGLYAITPAGRDALDSDYPAEAGFLQGSAVVHDAPTIKTIRLRGDRRRVEVQVDDDSVLAMADAVREVLAETHGDHEAVSTLEALVATDG